MPSHYDTIGPAYLMTKHIPWKTYAEPYTLFKVLGPLDGRKVIDVACGNGFFTRQLKEAGAGETIGIDLSERMIALAREEEAQHPQGIRYEACDAADLGEKAERQGFGTFDLAAAAWLFDYMPTLEHLRSTCQSLARVVRPGGRFVHMGGCFDAIYKHPEVFNKFYPIIDAILESHGDGSRHRWAFTDEGQTIKAENTMWTPETITSELESAGFTEITWPPGEPSPDGIEVMGQAYWDEYFEHPYFSVTAATRA